MKTYFYILQVHDGDGYLKKRMGFCDPSTYEELIQSTFIGEIIPKWQPNVRYDLGQHVEYESKIWRFIDEVGGCETFPLDSVLDIRTKTCVLSETALTKHISFENKEEKEGIYIQSSDSPVEWFELSAGVEVSPEHLYGQIDFLGDIPESAKFIFVDFDYVGDAPTVNFTDDTDKNGVINGEELGDRGRLQVEVFVNHKNLTDGGSVEILTNRGSQTLLSLDESGALSNPSYQYRKGELRWNHSFNEGETVSLWVREHNKEGKSKSPGGRSVLVKSTFGDNPDFKPTIYTPNDLNGDGIIANEEFPNKGLTIEVGVDKETLSEGGHLTINIKDPSQEKTIILTETSGGVLLDDQGDEWSYTGSAVSWEEEIGYEDTLSVTAKQTDKYGNSSQSNSLSVYVEPLDDFINKPTVTLTNGTGENIEDSITNAKQPEFSIGNIDPDVIKVEIFYQGKVIGQATPTTPGNAVFLWPEELDDGSYGIHAKVVDSNDNTETSDNLQFTILHNAIATIDVDPIGDDGLVDLAIYTDKITISGSVGGSATFGDSIILNISDKQGYQKHFNTIVGDGNVFTKDINVDVLKEARNKRIAATVSGTDIAGNEYSAKNDDDNGIYTIAFAELSKPTIALLDDGSGGVVGNTTRHTAPQFKIGNIDTRVTNIIVYQHDSKIGEAIKDSDNTAIFTVSEPLEDGTYTFIAKVSGNFGLEEASSPLRVEIITTADAKLKLISVNDNGELIVSNYDDPKELIEVKGSVSDIVDSGKSVTVRLPNVKGITKEYAAAVAEDKTFTLEIPVGDLIDNEGFIVTASISGEDALGNSYENASDTLQYLLGGWVNVSDVGIDVPVWDEPYSISVKEGLMKVTDRGLGQLWEMDENKNWKQHATNGQPQHKYVRGIAVYRGELFVVDSHFKNDHLYKRDTAGRWYNFSPIDLNDPCDVDASDDGVFLVDSHYKKAWRVNEDKTYVEISGGPNSPDWKAPSKIATGGHEVYMVDEEIPGPVFKRDAEGNWSTANENGLPLLTEPRSVTLYNGEIYLLCKDPGSWGTPHLWKIDKEGIWEEIALPHNVDRYLHDFDIEEGVIYLASGDNLYRRENDGSWYSFEDEEGAPPLYQGTLSVSVENGVLYMVRSRGNFWKRDIDGVWTELVTNPELDGHRKNEAIIVKNDIVYVCNYYRGVWKREPAGDWIRIDESVNIDYPEELMVFGDDLYVTLSSGNTIWKMDASMNWSQINLFDDNDPDWRHPRNFHIEEDKIIVTDFEAGQLWKKEGNLPWVDVVSKGHEEGQPPWFIDISSIAFQNDELFVADRDRQELWKRDIGGMWYDIGKGEDVPEWEIRDMVVEDGVVCVIDENLNQLWLRDVTGNWSNITDEATTPAWGELAAIAIEDGEIHVLDSDSKVVWKRVAEGEWTNLTVADDPLFYMPYGLSEQDDQLVVTDITRSEIWMRNSNHVWENIGNGDGAPSWSEPYGVCIEEGVVYVADWFRKLWKRNIDGSWSNIGGGTNAPSSWGRIYSITVENEEVYVVSSGKLWKRDIDGNWTDTSLGDENPPVWKETRGIHVKDGVVYVSDRSLGIWERSLDGKWANIGIVGGAPEWGRPNGITSTEGGLYVTDYSLRELWKHF